MPLTPTTIAWAALVLIAVGLYFLGLGSAYAPTNGDEMVYIHIARMTAQSGHWLPLQSELIDTRNTKPPLLIWQAMAAGGWGSHWSLWALRLPSVAYTLATTALLGWMSYRLSAPGPIGAPGQAGAADVRLRTACVAAALYLLFFSTFRYGRVYLTSAPETFWLGLPMWWLLWHISRAPAPTRPMSAPATAELRARAVPAPGLWGYTAFGLAMGLGAAYKSFALLAPAAATLWCALLVAQPLHWRTLLRVSLGVGWSTLLGLALFGLWFVLDPDPAAVWQEFVVAENAGKLHSSMGYWQAALAGPYPMWTQLYAYPANGGLLALLVLGWCLYMLWRSPALARGLPYGRSATAAQASRAALPVAVWVLVVWVGVWLLVFTLPNQRSERYLIPAMPAVAIGMALVWDRLPRLWFWLTLALTAPALLMLGRISVVMGQLGMASGPQVAITLIAAYAGGVGVAAGFYKKSWTRNASLLACLAVYASFTLMVQPLSSPEAAYPQAVQQALRGQRLAVPNGFTGQYERFHFVLPGARITPYDAEGRTTGALYPELPGPQRLQRLLAEFDAVVWLQDEPGEAPSCLPACTLLAQRWHVKSRHQAGEVRPDNLWQVQDWLFRREWLLALPRPTAQ